MTKEFDIVFIGSGPAGYAGSIRAAQLGKTVCVVEAGFIGGVCLNRGCIPTKSLLHSSQIFADLKHAEKYGVTVENPAYDIAKMLELRTQTVEKVRGSLERTLKNNGIEIIKGLAKLDDNRNLTVHTKEENIEIKYKNLVIATGSKPRMLPDLPKDKVLNSDTVLAQTTLPEKTLIIGSGAIGTEWARILNALGKQVCVVEMAQKLAPAMDESVSDTLARIFKKQKIEFYTGVSIEKYEANKAFLSNGKEIEFDKILVAIGRIPNLFGLDNIPFEKERGFLKVDENFKTNFENIYAAGDITGKQLLAHTASAQSIRLVEHIFDGKKIDINYRNIPAIIYGKPEIATVGYTEQALREMNADYKVSKLPLTIAAKAFIDGEIDGMVKVMSMNGIIVGAAVVANDASGLLQQLVNAIQTQTPISKLNEVVYAHPTTSEAISEAVLNLEDKALFVPKRV
ncbi:MAG: dihydrolipoyl dehydrogenase [bacterium]|nr:dihydrolipoyl dehydrogenase [bacterium]